MDASAGDADDRDVRDDAEGGSRRTCIVTRAAKAPDDMLRFVLDPEGRVVPDLRRRLPGRGVWVSASAELVKRAVATKGFSRGFKTAAEADADLPARVDFLLAQDALQSLSFANKAGLVLTGSSKVEAAIERERPAALLQASDGAPDGARKMRQSAIRRWGEAGAGLAWVDLFESTQLDLALGRSNVIHGLLKTGSASASFLARWRRLAQYRGQSASEPSEENASRRSASATTTSTGARRG